MGGFDALLGRLSGIIRQAFRQAFRAVDIMLVRRISLPMPAK